jgi:hypothetical protein
MLALLNEINNRRGVVRQRMKVEGLNLFLNFTETGVREARR